MYVFIMSIKYTIRSIVREAIRGHLFRLYYYNQIRKNEFSNKMLSKYKNKRLKKIAHSLFWTEIESDQIINKIFNSKILSKDDIKNNPQKYYGKKFKSHLYNYNSTSGTSGSPLKIKQSLECVQLEEAFVYRQMKWAGYSFGKRRVWLRGDLVVPKGQAKAPFWCRDYFTNTLMMSSYHISNTTCIEYTKELERFDPYLIQAYPSSIFTLAMWMKENDYFYSNKSLRSILTSSETLSDNMKIIIEERFNCKVYDWYGQAERVAAIGTCELGSKHLLTDYSLVELEGEEKKEIIGTSLNNIAMPLIRYRTGDYITVDNAACKCGRVFPVVNEVYGREDKVVTLSNGRVVARLGHIFKNVNNIIEAQIVQKSPDSFVINAVVGPDYTNSDESKILENAKKRLENVDIVVEIKNHIARGRNGKFEFIKVEIE